MFVPQTAFNLHKIADRENSRYYALAAVRFERDAAGNPLAIACDGKRLLTLTWREPTANESPLAIGETDKPLVGAFSLPLAACKQAARHKPNRRKPGLGFAAIDEQAAAVADDLDTKPTVKLQTTDGETRAEAEFMQTEGRYPNWRPILNADTRAKTASVTVDAKLLAELLEAVANHQGSSEPAVTLTIDLSDDRPQDHPLFISAKNDEGQAACGCLMPMTHENPSPFAWSPAEAYTKPSKPTAEPEAEADSTAEPTEESEPASQPEPPAMPEPEAEPAAAAVTEADSTATADFETLLAKPIKSKAVKRSLAKSQPTEPEAASEPLTAEAAPATPKPAKPAKARKPKPQATTTQVVSGVVVTEDAALAASTFGVYCEPDDFFDSVKPPAAIEAATSRKTAQR